MRDAMTDLSIMASSDMHAPLEKIALESYVPPAKPSLVGLSRAEIADLLGARPAQDARSAALGLGLCPRRAALRPDDEHLEGNARPTRTTFHGRTPRSGGRTGFQRRHPQMAAAIAERRQAREGA